MRFLITSLVLTFALTGLMGCSPGEGEDDAAADGDAGAEATE